MSQLQPVGGTYFDRWFYCFHFSSTVYETWTNILDQTERIGNAHQQAAETLENEVHSLIKDTIKNYETERKKQFSDVKQLKTDLKKTLEQHEKVKKSYEDACKAADAAKAVFEKADSDRNVTKAFVDKVRLHLSKKQFYMCLDKTRLESENSEGLRS